MRVRAAKIFACLALSIGALLLGIPSASSADSVATLDQELTATLNQLGFTGKIEASLEKRLGRPINRRLANLGRLLWFDTIIGLNNDNTCAGCHSPLAGFGDTQSIAIGIESNKIVGSNRIGPRNQRRAPMVLNNGFYPTLMWNSRFSALSGDPFDNSKGFKFPDPEGLSLSNQPTLLAAQAFIPTTERVEMAGFKFVGNNDDIRAEVITRLNASAAYRKLFGKIFPVVKQGKPITYEMLAQAIAEFEFTLTFANAPIDRFARGEKDAMTESQKKGAILFFSRLGCVQCHAVSGQSNEMFSDFQQHNIGIPQLVPVKSNVDYDGINKNEDFGLAQVSGDPVDRYKFRTSPLRNIALQPTFFHNGCFTTIEDAVRHHLDVFKSARDFKNNTAFLDADLTAPLGPIEPVLASVDPLLARPIELTDEDFKQLVDFLRDGLLDPRAKPESLRLLIPTTLPSGNPSLVFSN
ncbi:MAG: cytochrome c peroxidase [Acidobacteriota bacterium]